MITFLIFCCIAYELSKLLNAERFVAYHIRLQSRSIQDTDLLIAGLNMAIISIYALLAVWVLLTGNNLYAQGFALAILILSSIYALFSKKIAAKSPKWKVTFTILDSFLGVLLCCGMVYFYQKPM